MVGAVLKFSSTMQKDFSDRNLAVKKSESSQNRVEPQRSTAPLRDVVKSTGHVGVAAALTQ